MQIRRNYWVFILSLSILAILVAAVPALAAPPASPSASCGNVIHIVRARETLYSIARLYGVNMWDIVYANNIVNPNCIYVGQRLVIPVCRQTGVVHVVRAGETLSHIALRYGVSVWSIVQANNLPNANYIYVGQRLFIPGAAPQPQPPPQPQPQPGMPGPWHGEYFDNVALTGTPYSSREDGSINFDWGWGPPAGGMPSNYFSVRWTGTFSFAEGTYRFYAKVDDGVRVYVDGDRVINGWRDGGLRTYMADRALSSGNHEIKVEYYDSIQVARVYIWWKQVSGATPTPGPTPTPTPKAPVAGSGWYAEFFNNETLSGTPVFTRTDPWIGFEWKGDGPAPGVWADGFSIRWTTTVHLDTDHYRFCAMSDDGVRIWVGGQLVLDEWHANNGIAYCGTYWAQTGDYPVKVEYYEHGGKALLYVWWEPH